ncbi:hypothetical protein [Pseudarthrobacter cellobiosi]|uniref:hypothetical protein n=1 Tax=Pseudarthrobacter cellobiosi TaxID=2953654 RepID=UPI00208FC323|nr:hypothetical protein [Pseudarthrobacter sp. HLT1-5]MCO4257407.1 hypothetical protein [Pseudarthrobacter sp. HLT1-5]
MNHDETTLETLNLIKAQTAGVTSGTGLVGVDLTELVSLIPVNTPFLDSIPRKATTDGAKFCQWRVLTDINNLQADPGTAFDFAAPLALLNELDVSAPYGKIGYGYTVTEDAIDLAKGYANAHAIAVMNAMNQYKIGADRKLLGGQVFALPTPATPTVTTSTTGGSIAATTAVNVKVAARTGSNFNYGGSTIASAQGTVTTGAGTTNSAVATVTSIPGAVAYDWYVANFYVTTTTVNKVTITTIPTAHATTVPNIPGLFSTAPSAVPVADSSAKATDFNGLLATLAGDYATGGATGLVTRGSGVSSGATFQSLDGAAFTSSGQSINELDALFSAMFNKIQASPSRLLLASQEANSISKLLLSSAGGGTTFLTPNDNGRNNITAGGYIGSYINKAAGGVPVPLFVQPNMAPGTLVAASDSGAAFAGANISNTLELRDLRTTQDYQYATNRAAGAGGGPRNDGEVYSTSALVNRAPVAFGVISNVAAS